jgi:DNA (cytosine-5)-methyltransferase 1
MVRQFAVMKQPYQVPSLSEIQKIKGTNRFTAISTFSGCGGSCLGLEMAGYDIRVANEFIEAARETYAANHPSVVLDGSDIRNITGEHLLELAQLNRYEVDLLEGSPPCASFSTAGSRHKGWGTVKDYSDSSQRSDDLFFEFARLLDDIQPKVFIAENVKGLVTGSAKGYFKMILTRLRDVGYKVEVRLLDASLLGVPQKRQRVIFIGVRNDLGIRPVFPKPNKYHYTLYDALGKSLSVPENCGDIDPETGKNLSLRDYAVGTAYGSLPLGKHDSRYFQLCRPDPNKPSPTILASIGNVGGANPKHPFECRNFNLQEIRRICSFPDDFILYGTFEQRAERLGRAVPPLMMKAVGDTIRSEILSKL